MDKGFGLINPNSAFVIIQELFNEILFMTHRNI